MLVEHARNLVGVNDAVHAEYGDPGTEVIAPLACSLDGQQITVVLEPGSMLRRLHGEATVTEKTTCNYGLNPALQYIASKGGMVVAATDATGEVRAVERPDHPFFLATLYQPQLTSSPEHPHPVFLGLIRAAVARTANRGKPGLGEGSARAQ